MRERQRDPKSRVTAERQKRLSVMSKCGAGDDDDDDDIGRMPPQIEGGRAGAGARPVWTEGKRGEMATP